MIAGPGSKWIVICTLPGSKEKFAVSDNEGKFSLYPMGDITKMITLENVLVFDDSIDAVKWLKEFLKLLDPKQKKAFLDLRPALGKIALSQ